MRQKDIGSGDECSTGFVGVHYKILCDDSDIEGDPYDGCDTGATMSPSVMVDFCKILPDPQG